MELYDYERKHGAFVRERGAECTVLLKKDGRFPLARAGKIALYGSGARKTVKGGTGSGEVNSRYFVTVEQGLKNAGFEMIGWIGAYKNIRGSGKEAAQPEHPNLFAAALAPSKSDSQIFLNAQTETAVYVLSRVSGEGADRTPTEGDILLTKTEIRDILACDKQYANFMLVVNAGGVVDLTPVNSVRNILVLSQLGAETGNIFADILLGKQNPSGKLTTTWAAWQDYPTMIEFGKQNDTRYKEGIYVGYRYFDSAQKAPLYPFGFGLSYTEFEIGEAKASLDGDQVTVMAKVKNIGAYAGKEVVQLYVSIPAGKLDEPYQVLCGFAKTGSLQPGQEETVQIQFHLQDIAPYDEDAQSYILESGDYILRVGNSSRNTAVCAAIRVGETISVLRAKNVLGKPDFTDWKAPAFTQKLPENTAILRLNTAQIPCKTVSYRRADTVDPEIEALSDTQLIKINLGAFDPKARITSMIGNSGFTVAGAAGQTMMGMDAIPSMVMADGPAGLRLSREYAMDAKGKIHSLEPGIPASILESLPSPIQWVINLLRYKPKKTDKLCNQYATAIPISTAVAQSWNTELAEAFGKIIGAEMNRFGVHLWLAPALNIHRSIRCGRNFEYFSEDPLLSGCFAGAISRGVQTFPHAGTTIKHYAFNNQERNRTQNNSQVSERAAREIYLKGFGICIKAAQPKAVMTSYNLINGTHTSEHSGLIEDILRAEFGHQGIVMTDWIVAEVGGEKNSVHPAATAERVCMAGGDLFMPGSKKDFIRIKKALRAGTVTKKQLQINATRVLHMAKELAGK